MSSIASLMSALVVLGMTLLGGPVASAGEPPAIVTAELNFDGLHAGQKAVIAITLDVARGFHAQSHTPHDAELIPLKVIAHESGGVHFGVVQYPPGRDKRFGDPAPVNCYEGKVVFFLPIELAEDVMPATLMVGGQVRCQICDEASCLPPQSLAWSLQIRVVPNGEPTSQRDQSVFSRYKPSSPTTQRAGGVQSRSDPPSYNCDRGGATDRVRRLRLPLHLAQRSQGPVHMG